MKSSVVVVMSDLLEIQQGDIYICTRREGEHEHKSDHGAGSAQEFKVSK